MKFRIQAILLVILLAFSLVGCTEKIPQPVENRYWDKSIGEFEEELKELLPIGFEEKLNPEDLEKRFQFNFLKAEINDIQKYTGECLGVRFEVFCQNDKIYCIKIYGDATKISISSHRTDLSVIGYAIFLIIKGAPDKDQEEVWPSNLFDLENGEEKSMEGYGMIFQGERKGSRVTVTLTPRDVLVK